MQPLQYYQQQCQNGLIKSDPEQLAALEAFQVVYQDLQRHHKSSGLLRLRRPKPVRGLYIWGGVGIGKTLLMDCFFNGLSFPQKLRIHFHAFMRMVHQALKAHYGKPDPLQIVSKSLAKKYRVICFDEFIVTDIVDAMLLGRLLKSLTDMGVCFVTTSNTEPDELYKNGLQRTSFLPAIALIKKQMQVVHLSSTLDYRLQQIKKAGVFFTPDSAHARDCMEKEFQLLVHGHPLLNEPLIIHGRQVGFIKRTDSIIWFDFNEICHIPRSQLDYLSIAETYQVVFISGVLPLASKGRDVALLLIRLIDVLYDARTPLIFSSACAINEIFKGLSGLPDSARAESRLMEMQSEKYLTAHI